VRSATIFMAFQRVIRATEMINLLVESSGSSSSNKKSIKRLKDGMERNKFDLRRSRRNHDERENDFLVFVNPNPHPCVYVVSIFSSMGANELDTHPNSSIMLRCMLFPHLRLALTHILARSSSRSN